jgi:hypothetical protein
MAAVPASETILARHVFVSVLENQDRRFIDLESKVGGIRGESVVHISLTLLFRRHYRQLLEKYIDLFTSANASIHLMDQSASDHLEEDDPCSGIQDLLVRSPV